MTRSQIQVLVAGVLVSHMASAQMAPNAVESRGELLYSTHCIGCHTTQVHWRDKKLVTNWATLKDQVRRWSSNTGLSWGEEDILTVARHLNTRYYHFPVADGQMGGSPVWRGPTASTSFKFPMALPYIELAWTPVRGSTLA